MARRVNSYLLAGFLALPLIAAHAGLANAADPAIIPMAAPMIEKAAAAMTEFTSGWYLRGDVGYRWNRVDSAATTLAPSINGNSLGEAVSISGGVGYSRDWFRADVTLDWNAPANYRGDSPAGAGFYQGRIDTFTALVNGYIDFGTWGGLTPYVGAGVGASSVRTNDFVSATVLTKVEHSNMANFAWAYMAGISYRISNNLLVDVGYRHLSLGDTRTGIAVNGNRISINGLSSDEVRIGARYQID